jgi:hypothetical protein
VTSVGVVVNKDLYARCTNPGSEKTIRDAAPAQGRTTSGTLFQTFTEYPQKAPQKSTSHVSSSVQRYLEKLEFTPGLKKLLGDGKLVDHLGTDDNNPSLIQTVSDYSYSADRYSGDGWRVIGDAGGGPREKLIPPFADLTHHSSFHRPVLFIGNPSSVHRRIVRGGLHFCIHQR